MLLIEYSPYLFLSLSLILIWGRQNKNLLFKYAWLVALVLACCCAVYIGVVTITGVLITFLVGGLAWCSVNNNYNLPLRWGAGILFVASVIVLALHKMPGFNSTVILDNVIFTPGARAYSLYLNFDKTLIAVFILGIVYQRPDNALTWKATFKWLWLLPVIIGIVIFLALLTGHVKYEPKFHESRIMDNLWFWIWINLLFTCTVEEAFFRGLIQHQLMTFCSKKHINKWIAVGIASLLFGVAHSAGGGLYVALATVAGFGYGAVYILTGRIEASIICHFSLNLVHILLFTYPAVE